MGRGQEDPISRLCHGAWRFNSVLPSPVIVGPRWLSNTNFLFHFCPKYIPMKKALWSVFLYLSRPVELPLPQKDQQFRQLNKTSHPGYWFTVERPSERDSCSQTSPGLYGAATLWHQAERPSAFPQFLNQKCRPKTDKQTCTSTSALIFFVFFRLEHELQKGKKKYPRKPMVFRRK